VRDLKLRAIENRLTYNSNPPLSCLHSFRIAFIAVPEWINVDDDIDVKGKLRFTKMPQRKIYK
jgi:hypothetical protein